MKKKTFKKFMREHGYTHYRVQKKTNYIQLSARKVGLVRAFTADSHTPSRKVLTEFWRRIIVVEWADNYESFCEYYGFDDDEATRLYLAAGRKKEPGIPGETQTPWLQSL